jgi:hypothetical protein
MKLTEDEKRDADVLATKLAAALLESDAPCVAQVATLLYLAGAALTALCVLDGGDREANLAWAIRSLERSMDMTLQHVTACAAIVESQGKVKQ